MKFIYISILLLIISTANVKGNKQLFEMLDKASDENISNISQTNQIVKESKAEETKEAPSLFLQTNEKESNKEKEKSLFESQITTSEETKSGNEKSLFELENESNSSKSSTNNKNNSNKSTIKEQSKKVSEKSLLDNNNEDDSEAEMETKDSFSNEKDHEDNEESNSKDDEENTSFTEVKSSKKVNKKSVKANSSTNKKSLRKASKMTKSQKAKYCSTTPLKKNKRKFRRVCGKGSLKFNEADYKKFHNITKKLRKPSKKEQSKKTKRVKPENSFSFLEQKVNSLNTQLKDLIDNNTELKTKINNLESYKNDHIEEAEDMMSFIENQTSKLSSINKNYSKENSSIKNQLNESKIVYDQVLDKNNYSINYLGNQILGLEKEFTLLRKKLEETRALAKTKNAEAKNLNLEGHLNANSIFTEKATFGDIQINGEYLKLGVNSKIKIGDHSLNAVDLIENSKFVSMVKEHCGNNFENCKIVTRKEYDEEKKNEAEILKNVRKLRKDSARVFSENN